MTSTQHKPGHTWVVLAEEDGAFNVTLPLGFGRSQLQSNKPRIASYVYWKSILRRSLQMLNI